MTHYISDFKLRNKRFYHNSVVKTPQESSNRTEVIIVLSLDN